MEESKTVSAVGVAHVLDTAVKQAREELESALKEAYERAMGVMDVEAQQTSIEVKDILETASRQADALKRRIIGAAHLSARNKALMMVNKKVDEAFAEARRRLQSNIVTSDRYSQILKALILEGVRAVGGDNLLVVTNSRDRKTASTLVQKISAQNNLVIRLTDENLNTIGGAKITSSDGSISYDNTLEARLSRHEAYLRKQISELFMRQE